MVHKTEKDEQIGQLLPWQGTGYCCQLTMMIAVAENLVVQVCFWIHPEDTKIHLDLTVYLSRDRDFNEWKKRCCPAWMWTRCEVRRWNGVHFSLTEDAIVSIISACASLPAHLSNPSMKTAFGCILFPCFPDSSIASTISDTTFVPLPSFSLHFWGPILAHWFWHPYVVMAVISCQSLFHLLFHLVSSILLCCFWSIRNFILHGIAVLYHPCSLSLITPICFLYVLRSLFIKLDLSLLCDTSSFSLLLLEHIDLSLK